MVFTLLGCSEVFVRVVRGNFVVYRVSLLARTAAGVAVQAADATARRTGSTRLLTSPGFAIHVHVD